MFLDSSEEDNAEYTSLTMFLAAIGLHDWAPKVGILSKLWRPKRDFRKSIPIQNSCWIDEMGVKPKNIFKKQIMYKITILWDFARDLISLKKKESPQTIHFFHFFSMHFLFIFSCFPLIFFLFSLFASESTSRPWCCWARLTWGRYGDWWWQC